MNTGADVPGPVEAALARLAPKLVPGATGVAGVQRLTAGASLQTWRFDVVGADGSRPLILRRRGDGATEEALDTALPLSTEAALLTAAAQAGAPVPAVVRVCGPEDGLGEGLITERVEGETLGRRIAAAPEFETARGRLGAQAGAALAAIHAVEAPERLPIHKLSAAQTLARYADIYRETIPMRPMLEAAIRWLGERLPPEPDTPGLVHGDFRNGNLIVDPHTGLTAVLDWELAHLGDPAEDIGWICVNSWRFGVTEREVGGFATLDEFLKGYSGAGGVVPPWETIRFWQALGSFRWGVMTQMLGARGGDDPGTALERAVIATRLSECEVDLLPSPSMGEGRLAQALAMWRTSPDPARAPFLDRVADNAQAILDREAALRPAADEAAVARLSALLGETGDARALSLSLAQAIRDGRIPHDDPALLDHLRRTALDDLAIDQPRYRHALSEAGPTKPNR